MRRITGLVLAWMLLLAGCGGSLAGDGDIVTEDRTVDDFDVLYTDNGVEVVLAVNPTATGNPVLAVTTDSNLQEFLTTEVSNGELRVTTDRSGGVTPTGAFIVAATIAGLSDITADNGADATVIGSTDVVSLSANNGGKIDAEGLQAMDVTIDADNGAEISVCASGTVSGTVKNGAAVTVFCGGSFSGVETADGGSVSSSP